MHRFTFTDNEGKVHDRQQTTFLNKQSIHSCRKVVCCRLHRTSILACVSVLFIGVAIQNLKANDATPIPDTHYELLSNYCLKCHDEVEMKGDLNLDHYSINWNEKEQRSLWENALHMLQDGLMPPEDEDQPNLKERSTLISWLDEELLGNTPIGGTLPRRLSADEYRSTIQTLFDHL